MIDGERLNRGLYFTGTWVGLEDVAILHVKGELVEEPWKKPTPRPWWGRFA